MEEFSDNDDDEYNDQGGDEDYDHVQSALIFDFFLKLGILVK